MTSTEPMTSIGDILAGIFQQTFTDPRPCPLCGKPGPTYTDREKGTRYCLTCLETAVEEAEAELKAERQEMALLACHSRQIAA